MQVLVALAKLVYKRSNSSMSFLLLCTITTFMVRGIMREGDMIYAVICCGTKNSRGLDGHLKTTELEEIPQLETPSRRTEL